MEKNFISLGERTYYEIDHCSLQVIQKIRIHDLVICIIVGIMFYKIWFVSVPLICIGLLGLFVFKKVKFDKNSRTIKKDIYFFRYKIFNLYTLNPLNEFSLLDYKSDIDQDKRSDLFEINIVKDEKPYLIFSFFRPLTRDKLFLILSEFLS